MTQTKNKYGSKRGNAFFDTLKCPNFTRIFPAPSVLQILDEGEDLYAFSRSVSMPKEAFEKALSSNISAPFVAVCRFHNMTKVS